MFLHKVVLNVDGFRARMELGICDKCDCPLIVNVDVLHLFLMLPGTEVLEYSL